MAIMSVINLMYFRSILEFILLTLILGINNMILHTSTYNVNVNYVCRNFPVSCTYIYVSTFTFTLIQVNIYIYIYGIIGFVALIAYGTWSVFYQFAANINMWV